MDNDLDAILNEFAENCSKNVGFLHSGELHPAVLKNVRESIKNVFRTKNLNQEYIDQINTTKENKS